MGRRVGERKGGREEGEREEGGRKGGREGEWEGRQICGGNVVCTYKENAKASEVITLACCLLHGVINKTTSFT